jgi:hypothetical protein
VPPLRIAEFSGRLVSSWSLERAMIARRPSPADPMACFACILFLVAVVAAGAVEYEYVPTPMGYVLKHCVHEVPNEAHIHALEDGSTRVLHPDGTSRTIPRCDTRNGTYPTMRSRAQGAQVKGPPLPANYGASRICVVTAGCFRWMCQMDGSNIPQSTSPPRELRMHRPASMPSQM